MSANVILGIRVVPNEFKRIKIDNIDLENNVSVLREHASNNIAKTKDSIELIFGGIILEDNCSISSYGIKTGFTIYVTEKAITKKPIVDMKKPTKEQIRNVLRYWAMDFHSRSTLQKIYCTEILNVITAAHPELKDDPVSLAYLKDLELLYTFTDEEVFNKVIDAHPVLLQPLSELMGEILKDSGSQQATTSTGYSYSLEALSDEEDDSTEDTREGHPLVRNSSFNAITAAQLAAAIENAQTNFSSTGQVIQSSTQRPRLSGNVITNEMFGNALQQAFIASSSNGTGSGSGTQPPSNPGEESMMNMRTRLMPQLRQMQEMGLLNEAQNLRALQAANGDVQAAIELVFNGVIE